jgi:thioredoxin 1
MYKSYSDLGAVPRQNVDIYAVPEIVSAEHKQQLLTQYRLVCVNIYGDWCGPCKQTAPEYSILAQSYTKPGQCILVKENYDKKLTIVQGIPTYQIFVDGRQVDQVVGADLAELEAKLNQHLARIGGVSNNNMMTMQGPTPSQGMGPTPGRNNIRNYRQPSEQQGYNQYHGQVMSNMPGMSQQGPPQQPQYNPYAQPYQHTPQYN